jgi:UDP-N-acetylglucosamine diphosphorylase/glucosamine-1-phosphate N-acetyltransferase
LHPVKAVILAAGEGARMGPFTASVPKVMIPVGNRPLLESVVQALVENGVRDLVFVVGYRRERIQSHFQDGKAFHARITYVTQAKQLGTAHAIAEARPHLDESFVVLNGSNMVDSRFVEDLLGNGAKPAVLITQSERPRSYGVVTVQGEKLVAITEKPPEIISNLINTGAYALDGRIFEQIERLAALGKHDLPSAVSSLAQETEVLAVRTQGTWVDALYPWDLLRLNATILKGTHEVRAGTIEPRVTIRGRVSIGDGCAIRSGAYLQGPLSIGPGCEIGPNAVLLPSTSLGKNVRIGAHTSVANSILMDDVILGPACVVQDSVIGSGVVARAGLLAASGSGDVQIEGEWHSVPQVGALIGEDTEIGNGVSVSPGTVINERARVESGARLRGTIPAGAGVL